MIHNRIGIVRAAILLACMVIGIAASPLSAAPQTCLPPVLVAGCPPNMETTMQYILDLINSEAGATEMKRSVNTSWTYSVDAAGPCTLHLRENRQRLSPPDPTNPTAPVRETFNYLIPVGDIGFGPGGTHQRLDQQRVMHLTIFMNHGTIRRWEGNSSILPQDASVEFAAPINFGKRNVNIFEAPIRLQNALEHLAFLCQAATKPDTDPFRAR